MFSGAIRITDIDDYLGPESKCTVAEPSSTSRPGHFDQIKQSSDKTAKITLADCLACSGCVTSAETVLVEQQSPQQFMHLFDESKGKNRPLYVIVSPVVIVSLAKFYNISIRDACHHVHGALESFGATAVIDQTLGLEAVLVEAASEVLRRRTADRATPILCSECPGVVVFAEKTQPAEVVAQLSQVRSPQQLIAALIKTQIRCVSLRASRSIC